LKNEEEEDRLNREKILKAKEQWKAEQAMRQKEEAEARKVERLGNKQSRVNNDKRVKKEQFGPKATPVVQ